MPTEWISERLAAKLRRPTLAQGEQPKHGEQMVCTGPQAGILCSDDEPQGIRFLRELPEERCDQGHAVFKQHLAIIRRERRKRDRDAPLVLGFGFPNDQV